MMISKPHKLSLPILDRKLPSGWKNIIQYTLVKYRSIPNSKWFVKNVIIFDKRGFSLILMGKGEHEYLFTDYDYLTDELAVIDHLNYNFNYENQIGEKVTAEVVMLEEDALPPLNELKQKLKAGVRIPLVEYVRSQMLSEDEIPQFNGHKTSAPRKRAAPKKRTPAVRVNVRKMF